MPAVASPPVVALPHYHRRQGTRIRSSCAAAASGEHGADTARQHAATLRPPYRARLPHGGDLHLLALACYIPAVNFRRTHLPPWTRRASYICCTAFTFCHPLPSQPLHTLPHTAHFCTGTRSAPTMACYAPDHAPRCLEGRCRSYTSTGSRDYSFPDACACFLFLTLLWRHA